MPVSVTEIAITSVARFSVSMSRFQPASARSIVSVTPPWCVNLNALDSRFFSTCCRRFASVYIDGVSVGSTRMKNDRFFASATWRNVRST